MLVVIESKTEIAKCQKQFSNSLKNALKNTTEKNIGFRGGQVSCKTYFNNDENWWGYQRIEGEKTSDRHWNAFGLCLKSSGTQVINAEINIPIQGIDRRIAGVFAIDKTNGKTYLLHSGKIGGGREGVSKANFKPWFSGEKTNVRFSDGKIDEYFLLSDLNDNEIVENIFYFIKEVEKFKNEISNKRNSRLVSKQFTNNKSNTMSGFNPEFSGKKKGSRSSSFSADCKHGRVVTALHGLLQKTLSDGDKPFNNQFIDLAIENNGSMKTIFEVKTKTDRQSIYTGIGQILFHSSANPKVNKFLVLPGDKVLKKYLGSSLQVLGISLITYEIKKKDIRFYDFKLKNK